MDLTFKPPGPVAKSYMLDDNFVRMIIGPVGSAKSSTSIMEMVRRWLGQAPDTNNRRRSRWAVIRNTNPMLRTTVMKTYEDWLKPAFWGEPRMFPPPATHTIVTTLGDGTVLDVEVIFLSLDSEDDMKKLLSLELTGALISEIREIPKSIVDGVTQRLRRFPAMKDGGATWSGLIADTNMPDDDHWLAIMSGLAPPPEGMSQDEIDRLIKPANWSFFIQPPAMIRHTDKKSGRVTYTLNPDAENIQNLDPRYYLDMIEGKTREWIDIYVLNKLGSTTDGRPVHSDFDRNVHVADDALDPFDGHTIFVGCDFGLTPAAIFFQRQREQIVVLDEIVLVDASADQLGAAIVRKKNERFPQSPLRVYGDPAGDERSGADKKTAFQMLRKHGLKAMPVDTNDPEVRRGAMRTPLTRMVGGRPGILFDPRCKVTIAGLGGSWVYKRVRGSGGGYDDEPSKNRYSHPCEAAEYGLMGMGEGRKALRGDQPKRPPAGARQDPFARLQGQRRSIGRALR